MASNDDCIKCKMELRGEFTLNKDGMVQFDFLENQKANTDFAIHVYAIVEVVKNESWVRYVGETINSLTKRIDQYLDGYKYEKHQSTNFKVHKNTMESLKKGHKVILMSLLDDLPVTWAGYKVNLAKGIESALIAGWLPEWNGLKGKGQQLSASGNSIELIPLLI